MYKARMSHLTIHFSETLRMEVELLHFQTEFSMNAWTSDRIFAVDIEDGWGWQFGRLGGGARALNCYIE